LLSNLYARRHSAMFPVSGTLSVRGSVTLIEFVRAWFKYLGRIFMRDADPRRTYYKQATSCYSILLKSWVPILYIETSTSKNNNFSSQCGNWVFKEHLSKVNTTYESSFSP
jgi:hypothetical protein